MILELENHGSHPSCEAVKVTLDQREHGTPFPKDRHADKNVLGTLFRCKFSVIKAKWLPKR